MSTPTTYSRTRADVQVGLTAALLGVLYASLSAMLAGSSEVLEVQANLFVPYVAAPIACGVALAGRRPQLAAIAGACVAVAMVVAFYGATQATSAFALHSWGIEFWAAVALPAGGGAAVAGWASAARFARSRPLRTAFGLLLAGGVLAAWLFGPSLYRTAEALVAGQITALVVAALLNAELGWLRDQLAAR